MEVQNQLLLARDINYLCDNNFKILSNITIEVSKMLNFLIKKSKTLDSGF